MNRSTVLAVLPLLLLASRASAQSAPAPAPAPTAAQPAPASPSWNPPPPPVAPASGSPTVLELSTLKILKDKGILSQAEYDMALKDMGDSVGQEHVADQTSVVMGKFATTMYGFVEADSIYDTTQSFNDSAGNALVARAGSYAGESTRTQFSIRNSRIGFRMKAPEYNGIRTSAVAEMDFLGTQLPIGSGTGTGTEQAYFSNPTFRVRHMYLRMETPIVDILMGQYWQLYGWQSVYHPNTVEIQGVPGQLYSRTAQIRISKTVKSEDVIFEAAIAAMRPPQRNSGVPEGQAGLRFGINNWTGVTTAGGTGTSIQPASIAITGDARAFRVPNYAAKASTDVNQETGRMGTGVAIDAFIPVIPAKVRQGNALSLNGEFSTSYGAADLYTGLTGGAPAALPTGATAGSGTPDIDTGLAVYDNGGGLHLIHWTSYLLGLQYTLPGAEGKMWVSANYSHIETDNLINGFGKATATLKAEDWFDFNLFADVTPSVRLGLEYANFNDTYEDGMHAINHRGQFTGWYIF